MAENLNSLLTSVIGKIIFLGVVTIIFHNFF